MRVLLLLFFLLPFASMHYQQPPHLVIFASDGTFYKFLPESKTVDWYGSLGSNLMSFEMSIDKSNQLPSTFIVPTLDGHFLYINAHSEILINRKEVQQLLHVCLSDRSRQKLDKQSIQYFIYQKFEYYIINLKNGVAQDIETFLKNGIPAKMDTMIILKISKKYLKQLRKDLTLAWSTISSQLQLFPAQKFLENPKEVPLKQGIESKYLFRRIGNNEIEMIEGDSIFEMGSKSHILTIFEYVDSKKGYYSHPLKFYDKPKLAIDFIPSSEHAKTAQNLISSSHLNFNKQKSGFIHSDQVNANKKQPSSGIQVCINTFRTLQAISDQSKNSQIISSWQFQDTIHNNLSNYSLIFPTYQSLNEPVIINYGPTKQQPYIWIAVILMICLGSYGLYRMKINSLLSQISAIQSKTGQKLQQFQQKLGLMQQLKKMYEVYWDKIVYQVAGEQWYEHIVFEGKFLNQPAFAYAIRLQGTDVITLQHKLNTLLNFSHIGLAKLYYYTKNSQFLLIFTQKIAPLTTRKLPDHFKVQATSNVKKQSITQIIEAVAYLDNKIQINSLPIQALNIEPITSGQGQTLETHFSIKLNAVPCLLRKPLDDSDQEQSRSWSADNSTYELRENIIFICNLLINEGQIFCKKTLDEKLKNQAYSQEEYLQFFDFVLYEVRGKAQITDKDIEGGTNQNLRELMFKDILDHPYLWDSKRKILFLSDFSNYIETHIDQSKVRKLQHHAKDYNVIKTPWIKQFHFLFVKQINNYRKYDYESVRDLIRVIRNKLNHFHQIPKQVRNQVGKTPEGFIEYCLELFPKLLHFAFVYTRKKKWKLHMK